MTRKGILGLVLSAALVVAGAYTWRNAWSDESVSLDDFTRYVFVPSQSEPLVTVIDSLDDRVVARIKVPRIPHQVLVSAPNRRMLVLNREAPEIYLYDLIERKPGPTISLTARPRSMILDPEGYLLAVDEGDAIEVIEPMSGRKMSRVDGLTAPIAMTFSSEGEEIFVTNGGDGDIHMLDIFAKRISDSIQVADGGKLTAYTRAARPPFGIVSIENAAEVAIVDRQSLSAFMRIGVGRDPSRPYGTADGRFMLVPNQGDGTVSMVSMREFKVTATFASGKDIVSVNTGWFETIGVAMSRGDKKAVILDLENHEVAAEIDLPGIPDAGVVTPNGEKLYVALQGVDQVAVISLKTRQLLTLIDDVGADPSGIVMGLSNNYCH